MFKFRDLTIVDITPKDRMVISCDSSGGIGNKERDVVKVEPEIIGYYTTQVALMELLATGATPITIVNTLGVEMDDTGKKIIEGIKRAIKSLNLDEDILITGSTEENIPVCQTSMGITIIGMIETSKWRLKRAERDDLVVAIGIPKVGQELVEDKGLETMSVPILLDILKKPYVKDVLPVGSKGIAYEMNVLASTNELSYNIYNQENVDVNKSAGPATCVLVAINKTNYDDLRESFSIPVNIIGILN